MEAPIASLAHTSMWGASRQWLRSYPETKFIVTAAPGDLAAQIVRDILARLAGADVIVLDSLA